jgi:hypothetical protein
VLELDSCGRASERLIYRRNSVHTC